MTSIIIPAALEQAIKENFDTNYEVGCFFLAAREIDSLVIREHLFIPFSENNVSASFLNNIPPHFLSAPEEEYEIVTGHMHSRKYGDQIESFDPYWTIPQNSSLYQPGEIVDGKFFVTRKERAQGDSGALKHWTEYFKTTRFKEVDKTLFIHPHYGSEGRQMTPDLVSITAYRYAANLPFNVEELHIMIK
jgi:hypothetical protein